jgi:hypothetical protein
MHCAAGQAEAELFLELAAAVAGRAAAVRVASWVVPAAAVFATVLHLAAADSLGPTLERSAR